MLLVCSVELFVNLIAIKALNRNTGKWIILFNCWWLFLLLLSALTPYGGYKVSDKAYLCFAIFLLLTNIGYIFTKPTKTKDYLVTNNQIPLFKQYESHILHSRPLIFFIIGLVLILAYYAYKYTVFMNSSSVLNARLARFYVGYVFGSTIELLFFNYIVSAGRFLFVFILAFSMVHASIKNLPFVFSAIGLLLYSYFGGSRFPIVMFAVELLIIFIINSETNGNKLTTKKILRMLIIAGGIVAVYYVLLYFTAYRLGMNSIDFSNLNSTNNILYDQLVGYNIGPIASFSKLVDSGALNNHYYFGRGVLLNGIDEFFCNVLSLFGITIKSARYVIGEIAASPIYVGNRTFNALYTCLFWFFSDMGYIGIAVYSLMLGCFVKKAITNYYNNNSLWSLMLISHVMYYLLLTNSNWDINAMDSLLYIGVILYYERKSIIRFRLN